MAQYLTVLGVTVLMWAYLYWTLRIAAPPDMSGDCWYMRRMAFTDNPVSPPYCWRPMLPWLARLFGFDAVCAAASILTPIALLGYLGSTWNAAAISLAFVGIRTIYAFNIKNPEYAEGLGHLLFVLALWGMREEAWWGFLAIIAATLCREALGAALVLIALFWSPVFAIPAVFAGAFAYFTRNEDKDNRHPLIEKTSYETFLRWARVKRDLGLHFACTLQTTRTLGLSVPFVWDGVSAFARTGLIGLGAIAFFALPASGQSRHFGYAFALFAPFAVALGPELCWLQALICWFWPYDYAVYNESGGQSFGFAR